MSDPFSVAGGAVGVISLGLTVCQGLLAYYGPLKAYDEQIHDVASRITNFDSTLKILKNVLAKTRIFSSPLTSPSANLALDSIFNCLEGLNRLRRMLEKCKRTSTGLSGCRIQFNKLMYPFKRDTLMALLETVSWLQAHLNTSLQTLNMAMLVISQEQTDTVLAFSASSALETSQLLLTAQRSDQRGMSIEDRLVILEDHLKQMQRENIRNKAQPVLAPGLLRSALEHQSILDEDSRNQGTTVTSQCNRRRKECSCRMTYSLEERNANTASTRICELHTESKTIINLLQRRIFCRWALRISLEISYSSIFGAGGFSISPKLDFRAIVPRESPIFITLRTAKESLKSRDISTVIHNTYNALTEAFRAGEASKSDTCLNGNNILHIVTGWQCYSSYWDSHSRLVWRSFIQNLLQAGLSPDLVNDFGETPVDNMIDNFGHESNDMERQQITIDICSDLLEVGGYMTLQALDWRHRKNIFNPFYDAWRGDGRRHDVFFEDLSFRLIWKIADEKGQQDIYLPEELHPLVYRSRKLMTAQLRRGIDFQQWIESYTRWVDGLTMILQSGHAAPEGALIAACEANCEESVNVLVNDYKCFIGYEELKIASLHPNKTIVNIIVGGLIHRRKQLQALTENNLPRSVQDQLCIKSQSLLNIHAYEAYKLIAAVSVGLEGLLEHYQWSVFDYIGVNFDLANRLWSAGFRDVDKIDGDNQTCLTKAWRNTPPCDLEVFLQKMNWLISKGANLYHQNSSGLVLHDIGNNVGSILYWMKEDNLKHSLSKVDSLSESSKTLLRTILSDNTRDGCKCACSPNGCSPMTTLLSGLLPRRTDHVTTAKLIHIFAQLLSVALFPLILEPELDRALKDHLSIDIIRFITFDSLGISHTCLHGYRKFEPEEIKEIQDEERLLILDLQRLLTEFLDELKMRRSQLPSYITGLWRARMASFLSTSRPHSAKEVTQFLELGVILDSHETQDEVFLSSQWPKNIES